MQSPDALRVRLHTAWSRNRHEWLAGGGEWPRSFNTEAPTEAQALSQWEVFDAWLAQWREVSKAGAGQVVEALRQWPRLGTQQLPCAWRFDSPESVAAALGQSPLWQRVKQRFDRLMAWGCGMTDHVGAWRLALARHFDVLADASDADLRRLQDVVAWLLAHPASGLYPRQLPVAGIDSKWMDVRRAVVTRWLSVLRGDSACADFYQASGLRAPPDRLRMRLLDASLRAQLGGIADLEAPVEQIAALSLSGIRQVLIVENLYTCMAMEDLPGTVLFMGRGNAIEAFAALPWLACLPILYWGDLDTYGMAILSRLRGYLPNECVQSLLMDTETLHAFKTLWGEDARHPAEVLPNLTDAEQQLYRELRHDQHGIRVRLEQERIAWDWAWSRLSRANPA
ncbi:hypothetical protein ISP15_02700 [Dyella jejuensis]|uniref:DUF3322 and DUF2220 domain-containing protein n=1 Tax=Dyella jejuensis TaxID=1432009 RepID=A0ABW8JG28_9GAMM